MIPRWLRQRLRRTQGHGNSGSGQRGPGSPDDDKGGGGTEARWVVVDVEASGLDANSDRLLAIAGVAVVFDGPTPRLELGDSFEAILRQDEPEQGQEVDRPNILLHGIGVGAQRTGVPPGDALAAFSRWAADAPILGYHAAFDRTLIRRHSQTHLGRRPDNTWIDLEHVVLQLAPGLPDRSLDSAMAHLGIDCPRRHQAAADALATAEVLLKVWAAARGQMGGRSDIRSLQRLAARHNWLPRERS